MYWLECTPTQKTGVRYQNLRLCLPRTAVRISGPLPKIRQSRDLHMTLEVYRILFIQIGGQKDILR